jgi:hypothetical protein
VYMHRGASSAAWARSNGLDAQVPEQGGHVGSEVFAVLVDEGQPSP